MSMWSLAELNALEPCKDYGDVLSNLESIFSSSAFLQCWRLETVPVNEITQSQLIDDPDDHDGHAKVKMLRLAVRRNALLSPLVLIHAPAAKDGTYFLLDGRHRFNAAYLERVEGMRAWVGHIECCGGPSPDLDSDG
ncbi:hypothetical protein GCM10009827_116860 [Dactylosporangium maewongense]|uniref:ParB/Sulfiredoxin domain-containing protein n=1 Tax=Dactylosporangium maewongense TaxID=634393 RepID=A0ABN2DEJ4_9ACTN